MTSFLRPYHRKGENAMSIKLLNGVATALAVALVASPCLAADEATDEEPYIEEIIVTAEKREESILDVPLTMTAFSGQMIEELGMTKPADDRLDVAVGCVETIAAGSSR